MNNDTLYKRLFTPFILSVMAYEWLVSGLDKLLNGQFIAQLQQQLTSSQDDIQYSFYSSLLKQWIIPHSSIFAVLVEIGEIAIGTFLLIIAVALFRNKLNPLLIQMGIWTCLISAFMVLNFFFFQGGALFVNPADPFDEGIPIDFILFLMQILMTIFFYVLYCKNRKIPGN